MEIENCQMRGRPVVLRSLPVNLRGSGWSDQVTRILRIILQEKNGIPLSRYNLVHKFVPKRQAMRIPDAKAAVRKIVKNWRNTSMAADEGQKQKWNDHLNKENKKYILRRHGIFVIFRTRSWSHSSRIQRPSCIPRVLLWKMIQDHVQYSLSEDHRWRKVAK